MIFHPVLHPALLAVFAVAALGVVVFAFIKTPSGGARLLWGSRALLVVLIFAALLRPGIPGGTTSTLAMNTDIVLAIDTTASIQAEDWAEGAPRLEGVREDVRTIIESYPGARYALVTFDAQAQLRLPMTTDTSAVMSALDVLRPEVTTQSRGSSVGIAAKMVAETLRGAAERDGERARMVFYFGDGEQTVSSGPESFGSSKEFTDGGLVLGYGTAEGGQMRITTGSVNGEQPGYIEYQGKPALSVIDEKNLQNIGDQLGIEYLHRTSDGEFVPPQSPSTSTSYADDGVAGNVIELFWIPVLGVIALLGLEVARATAGIVRMRTLAAPRSPRKGEKS